MKIIEKLSTGFVLFLMSVQPALAVTCRISGEEVPCDQMPSWTWAILIAMGLFLLFFFVFWLLMLFHAIRDQTKDKTKWILLIIFLNFAGAVLYYLYVRKNAPIELKEDEQILADVVASLFRGVIAIDGRLKITNQRLVFVPRSFIFQKKALEMPLSQIQEVKPRNVRLIVPLGILIRLVSGSEYKLSVWHRKELMELINGAVRNLESRA